MASDGVARSWWSWFCVEFERGLIGRDPGWATSKMGTRIVVWLLCVCSTLVGAQEVTLAGNNYANNDCETPLHCFVHA